MEEQREVVPYCNILKHTYVLILKDILYQCSDHFLCFVIFLKDSRVVIHDSANMDMKGYIETEEIIQWCVMD